MMSTLGTANQPADLPDPIYLPCAESVASPAQARPLMRRTEDGRLLMIVYSDTDKLYAGWGEDQPWLAIRTKHLSSLQEALKFDLIGLDLDVPRPSTGGTTG
jgi:hypothetical protein